MKVREAILIVVKQVGGYKALAEKLNVSASYVYKWVEEERKVPATLVNTIVKMSQGKIKAKHIRPDVFKN